MAIWNGAERFGSGGFFGLKIFFFLCGWLLQVKNIERKVSHPRSDERRLAGWLASKQRIVTVHGSSACVGESPCTVGGLVHLVDRTVDRGFECLWGILFLNHIGR